MQIIRWSPYKKQTTLDQIMNELLQQTINERTLEKRWNPALDIHESETEIKVFVELPGMDINEMKAELVNNVLTISGERKHESSEASGSVIHVERSYGAFHRSIQLAAPVEADQVNASYKNGVLIVTLPKTRLQNSKKVEVKAE